MHLPEQSCVCLMGIKLVLESLGILRITRHSTEQYQRKISRTANKPFPAGTLNNLCEYFDVIVCW